MKILAIFLLNQVFGASILELRPEEETQSIPLSLLSSDASPKTSGSSLSWCIKVSLDDLFSSYCVFSGYDLALVIRDYSDQGFVDIKGLTLQYTILRGFVPHKWTDMCMTYKSDTFRVYIDTILVAKKTNEKLKNNNFTGDILQTVKFHPDMWFNNVAKRFYGEVYDFNIWSLELSHNEVVDFFNGTRAQLPDPDIFDWSKALFDTDQVRGIISQVDDSKIYKDQHDGSKDVFIFGRDFTEDYLMCGFLGGMPRYPAKADDIPIFTEYLAKDSNISCRKNFRFPLMKDPADPNNKLIHMVTKESVPMVIPWRPDQPNGGDQQPCYAVYFDGEKLAGADLTCVHASTTCFVCAIPLYHKYIFQGLELEEDFYLEVAALAHDQPSFIGSTGSRVIYDQGVWKIIDVAGHTLYNFDKLDRRIPLGKQAWTSEATGEEKLLKLTQVCI